MTMMRTYLKIILQEGKSWSVFLESPLGKSKMKSKNIVLSSGQ